MITVNEECKERPIIFTSSMVRAILDGRKTQTRRVIKIQPESTPMIFTVGGPKPVWCIWPAPTAGPDGRHPDHGCKCPYGRPGDRLWVREKFASPSPYIVAYDADAECGAYLGDGCGGQIWIRHGVISQSENYETASFPAETKSLDDYGKRWRSPIHMPRWASRILLEITSICVERLQDITEADAKAEGVEYRRLTKYQGVFGWHDLDSSAWRTPQEAYRNLWDKINSHKHPWESNPWVWVIEFKKVSQ